ncbi:hypothetical protein EWM64_g7275 [Hericium alpestre]|uniref:Uncharacterized protein n=1 Tax=Hericium alpestre TaxID=135208 RepID=A0A4Y9ZTC1_9AGAM|nr:hypothetical protein EWM64_g7275 [Hericium alpestre]
MQPAYRQPPSNHVSLDASRTHLVMPSGPATPAAQATAPLEDQVQQLINSTSAQRPLLRDNVQLMSALTSFCPEYTPAIINRLLATIDERTGDVRGLLVNQVLMQREIRDLKLLTAEISVKVAENCTNGGASGNSESGGGGEGRSRSNEHPMMKKLIHEMFWKLCGVDEDDEDDEDNIMLLPSPPAEHPDKVEQEG